MSWESYKESVQRLDTLISEKRFAQALGLVDELLKRNPGSVALLIKHAMLIQVQEEETDLIPLATAVESLERAIELDSNSVEALIELGNFEYAVADQPESALGRFEQAISHAESGLKAALIGLAKCQLEIGYIDKARCTLDRAKTIFPDDLEILMLEDELAE